MNIQYRPVLNRYPGMEAAMFHIQIQAEPWVVVAGHRFRPFSKLPCDELYFAPSRYPLRRNIRR